MFIYFDFIILFYHVNIDFEVSSEISILGPLDPRKWLLENAFICLWLGQASKHRTYFQKIHTIQASKTLGTIRNVSFTCYFIKYFIVKFLHLTKLYLQHSHQTFILGRNVREKLILEKRSLFWRQLRKSVKMFLQKNGWHDFIFIAEK